MAEVLVVVEATKEFGVKKVTCEMLTLARELGTPSAVVLGGAGAAEALSAKLGEYGAEKIYAAESEEIDGYLVAPKATVLAALVQRTLGRGAGRPLHPAGVRVLRARLPARRAHRPHRPLQRGERELGTGGTEPPAHMRQRAPAYAFTPSSSRRSSRYDSAV